MSDAAMKIAWRHSTGLFNGSYLEAVEGGIVVGSLEEPEVRLTRLSLEGDVLWSKTWSEADTTEVFFGLGDRLYLEGRYARAVELGTGKTLAERELPEGGAWLTGIVSGGPVYWLAGAKRLIGLDRVSLDTAWEVNGSFALHGSHLCNSTPGVLEMVEPVSGSRKTYQTGDVGGIGQDTHFENLWCWFGMRAGGRAAFDLESGEAAWRHVEPSANGVLLFGGGLALSRNDRTLLAYDLKSGLVAWARDFAGAVTSRHVQDGRAFVGTADQHIHVLDAATGESILSQKLDYKVSGYGFEPSPVVPVGQDHIVVGTRHQILGLLVT